MGGGGGGGGVLILDVAEISSTLHIQITECFVSCFLLEYLLEMRSFHQEFP